MLVIIYITIPPQLRKILLDNSSELLAKAKQTTDEEKSKELEEMSKKLEEKSKELEDKRKELDEKCKELENERRERLKLSELLKEEKKRTALLEDKVCYCQLAIPRKKIF